MSWRDLLQTEEKHDLPWVGGRSLTLASGQTWGLAGKYPKEHGWHTFRVQGRTAHLVNEEVDPNLDLLVDVEKGYLVGDRFIAATSRVDPDPKKIIENSERVFLVEEGLERFAYVSVGRLISGSPLIFKQAEFPLGAEDAVLIAFEDEKDSVAHIPGVSPALDAAFRMETYQREEAERIRRELEEQRRKEELRQRIQKQLGDAAGRRELAKIDFKEAARAALRVGGAKYLDHRRSRRKNEMVVKFRMLNRRFECTCHKETLRVIDSGICLLDHRTNERGDTYFTLESLPTVIQQAEREGRLVIFRHVD